MSGNGFELCIRAGFGAQNPPSVQHLIQKYKYPFKRFTANFLARYRRFVVFLFMIRVSR
jgi:hypothetical protein